MTISPQTYIHSNKVIMTAPEPMSLALPESR